MTVPLFNARKFLQDQFINPPGVVAFLAAYLSGPPALFAVEKWFQRNAIPGDWLAVLLGLIEFERGEPARLAGYLGEGCKR